MVTISISEISQDNTDHQILFVSCGNKWIRSITAEKSYIFQYAMQPNKTA
ncbi:hypothetical protein Mpsy_2869 [Methanolobus psychrophilus R15]|nr:hypothetical protein Mpsy_2869 [Methanolobus psychrophilus R15]